MILNMQTKPRERMILHEYFNNYKTSNIPKP